MHKLIFRRLGSGSPKSLGNPSVSPLDFVSHCGHSYHTMTRSRRHPEAEEPKARVLHTRIPESLEDAIKTKARRLRIPVSNLVRNALEQAFQLVENVVGDGLEIAEAARRGAERVREAAARPRAEIYGWQELIVNRDERCRDCGAELDRGEKAYRGLSDLPDAEPVFLCPRCLKKIGKG